jgi:hypothetical protein
MDTYTLKNGETVSLDRPIVPWLQWEDITISASEIVKESSEAIWTNGTEDLIVLDYITFDMNSLDFRVRFGVAGRIPVIKDYVAPAVLDNTVKMNRAQDNSYPTLLFRKEFPFVVPPQENVTVLLRDTLDAAARNLNVAMSGLNQMDRFTYMADRQTVPQNGTIGAVLKSDEKGPLRVTHVQLYEESVGSAGDLSGLDVWIKGVGMRQWMRGYMRGSLVFPNRNGDGLAYRPPNPLVLEPGDILDWYAFDLRS